MRNIYFQYFSLIAFPRLRYMPSRISRLFLLNACELLKKSEDLVQRHPLLQNEASCNVGDSTSNHFTSETCVRKVQPDTSNLCNLEHMSQTILCIVFQYYPDQT